MENVGKSDLSNTHWWGKCRKNTVWGSAWQLSRDRSSSGAGCSRTKPSYITQATDLTFSSTKNSQPTTELITGGDQPLKTVFFFHSLRAKPVLTPIASCQESAGTAWGQDLCWNQTCLNSPHVTWASHTRADIVTALSQASKRRTRVFKSKQKRVIKTN